MRNLCIAPSILAADFYDLGSGLRQCETGGADRIHFDVMDGCFVPEISFGETVLRSIKAQCALPFDVHLMVVHPEKRILSFIEAGADNITIHLETTDRITELLKMIHEKRCSASLSVKPGTPIESVFPYLDLLDMVLVMTVEPGFGGQAFLESSYERIAKLHTEINRRGLEVDIEVDGGIDEDNIRKVKEAGANVFVSGSSVFKGCIPDNIAKLRTALTMS